MRRRLLDVTAYTTLDFVEGRAYGTDWEEQAPAVVDVGTPEESEDATGVVRLSVELDGTDLERLEPHVDRLALTPAQARTLAADLTEHADRVEGE